MALSFLHFHFPLSLLRPFIKVYFYLSARGWERMAPALAAWHFVKIVSCGTSNLTKNNSLCSGATFLPAETTASQPFWVTFGGISGNDGVGERKQLLGLKPKGWGKAVTCCCCFK